MKRKFGLLVVLAFLCIFLAYRFLSQFTSPDNKNTFALISQDGLFGYDFAYGEFVELIPKEYKPIYAPKYDQEQLLLLKDRNGDEYFSFDPKNKEITRTNISIPLNNFDKERGMFFEDVIPSQDKTQLLISFWYREEYDSEGEQIVYPTNHYIGEGIYTLSDNKWEKSTIVKKLNLKENSTGFYITHWDSQNNFLLIGFSGEGVTNAHEHLSFYFYKDDRLQTLVSNLSDFPDLIDKYQLAQSLKTFLTIDPMRKTLISPLIFPLDFIDQGEKLMDISRMLNENCEIYYKREQFSDNDCVNHNYSHRIIRLSDGNSIIVIFTSNIYTVNLNTKKITRLFTSKTGNRLTWYQAAVSNNERFLYFMDTSEIYDANQPYNKGSQYVLSVLDLKTRRSKTLLETKFSPGVIIPASLNF